MDFWLSLNGGGTGVPGRLFVALNHIIATES
jgi:hypothetical protein